MTELTFIHFHKTDNVGDIACSPKHYFDFPAYETTGFHQRLSTGRTVVYGGGQIFNQVAKSFLTKADRVKNKVIWGVGISKKHSNTIEFDLMRAQTNLISSRNKNIKGCDFVPCASAMSPLFDQKYEIQHRAVLFSHGKKSDSLTRVKGMPEMSNLGCTMQEAIAFMGSAEIVVTNSFHGTYWAMCLGRRVLCVPFSDKFLGFDGNPVTANPTDWPEYLNLAEKREEILPTARIQNQKFYEKCRQEGAF